MIFALWLETFAHAGDGDGGGGQFSYLKPKLKKSTAAAVDFWILLATNTYLIPKFKIQISAAPAAEF